MPPVQRGAEARFTHVSLIVVPVATFTLGAMLTPPSEAPARTRVMVPATASTISIQDMP